MEPVRARVKAKVVAPVLKAVAVKPTATRALLLTLVAACLAWVAWSGSVPTDYEKFGAPPAAAVVAAPVIAPLAAPVVPAEPVLPMMCVNEAPPEAVEPAAAADVNAPVVEKAVKKAVRAVKRKRAPSEEFPDAPWLTPSPKRGRR